jgi:hypothetical protein
MTIEQMRAAIQARPFRPFIMHIADGGSIPVQHPEFFLSVPSGRTVIVVQPDDTTNIVDLLLVSHLEFQPASKPARGHRKS